MSVPLRIRTGVVLVSLLVVCGGLQAQRETVRLSLEARWITTYKSLCDLEPRRPPKTVTIPPGGGWTVAGCSDLKKRPVAPLSITVTNTDNTTRQFEIPLLSEITIRTGSMSAVAAAFYVPWGAPSGFATDLQGHLIVELAPRASVDFIYLLPKSGADATIAVKGYGPITLRRD